MDKPVWRMKQARADRHSTRLKEVYTARGGFTM